jgi:hypothetical protein
VSRFIIPKVVPSPEDDDDKFEGSWENDVNHETFGKDVVDGSLDGVTHEEVVPGVVAPMELNVAERLGLVTIIRNRNRDRNSRSKASALILMTWLMKIFAI